MYIGFSFSTRFIFDGLHKVYGENTFSNFAGKLFTIIKWSDGEEKFDLFYIL